MEYEEVLKENEELKKQIEALRSSKKIEIVESILKLTEDYERSELMEKSDEVLKTILSYEKDLTEADEEESSEEKTEETPAEEEKEEGEGVVEEEKSEEEPPAEESLKGIVYDDKSGEVSMSESLYSQFNKEVRESIYR